jgi:hypothetical protein
VTTTCQHFLSRSLPGWAGTKEEYLSLTSTMKDLGSTSARELESSRAAELSNPSTRDAAHADIEAARSLEVVATFKNIEIRGEAEEVWHAICDSAEKLAALVLHLGQGGANEILVAAGRNAPSRVEIRSTSQDWFESAQSRISKRLRPCRRYWLYLYRPYVGLPVFLTYASTIFLLAASVGKRLGMSDGLAHSLGGFLALSWMAATIGAATKLWPRLDIPRDGRGLRGQRTAAWSLGLLGTIILGVVVNLAT